MGILNRLFGSPIPPATKPDITFGRYSDTYKEASKYEAWDQALDAFEAGDYLDSYQFFFTYLRDDHEDNVRFHIKDGTLHFELFQGSRKITGFADRQILKAEAKIAKAASLNVGFMRRLLEKNFHLKYSKFALDPDNNIVILFDTFAVDSSPYKLYYALKELATNADKQDDLLLDEFSILQPIDASHILSLPYPEKEAKYDFLQTQLTQVLHELDQLDEDRESFPGGTAYLLLDVVYKTDYLLKPEGYLMETLERVHRKYFEEDGQTTRQKNSRLRKEMEQLLKRPKEDYFKEFYRVVATFGITNPINHDRVLSFIDSELNQMDWYRDNGFPAVALAIPGYIIGYCLFNYALPKPDRELFHLFYEITEAPFFKTLGFHNSLYDPDSGKFDQKAIRKAIDQIVTNNRKRFPNLQANTATLDFSNLTAFCRSFLLMVRNMDMVKLT